MTPNRAACLKSIRDNSGQNVVLVTHENVHEWLVPGHPLHPSFVHLSGNHKGDYMRCYLMHFHGGGHTDIKRVGYDWSYLYNKLDNSDAWALGYPEIGPHGTPCQWLQPHWRTLIGNGCYIFKPNTPLTTEWYEAVLAKMDEKADALSRHPAIAPREQPAGYQYPLAWAELGGFLFHPVNHKYHDRVLHDMPVVNTQGYL